MEEDRKKQELEKEQLRLELEQKRLLELEEISRQNQEKIK